MIDKLNKNISILNENPIISKNFAKMILDRKNILKKQLIFQLKKNIITLKEKKLLLKKKVKILKVNFLEDLKGLKDLCCL